MKKIIELVKQFAAWVVKWWTIITTFVATWWGKLVRLATSKVFILTFPAVIFAYKMLTTFHFMWLIIFALWMIPTIAGTNEPE